MPDLVAPTLRLELAWREAHAEWGPGRHEDGFGLRPSDDVDTPAGFRSWVDRLTFDEDTTQEHDNGHVHRWMVEDGRVLGGIVLRWELDGTPPPLGHIGFGVRPSARRRGVAGWALRHMLDEARRAGLSRVMLMCTTANEPSARTIERGGGVLDGIADTPFGPARRYWIAL
ncbi:GNAT family N-acetyltransferase [Paractinoplanes ferrugineus]|uniref:Acetyltransferase n=1 Tax=Paractinoplanes ferrugineus TaxID=113564 RepID=A0A919MDI2_9ACTN|nr:GNAT family N-acetyltransferase [Actinoplanes ferrugineus]GIE10609.1 acetyltransferase [Actinoplanes ferrugineus]